jgi:hypothetical protein
MKQDEKEGKRKSRIRRRMWVRRIIGKSGYR